MEYGQIKNLKMYTGCLIIVDVINGFLKEGLLHDKKIGEIVPRIVELIKDAKKQGKLIVFIKDTHTEKSTEQDFFGIHCQKGTKEAELIDELKSFEKTEDTISIEKNNTSFMEAPDFRRLLEEQTELTDFDIVGCCSDICVINGTLGLACYLDQWNRKRNIRVHEDAIATYNADNRKEYPTAAKLLGEQMGIQYVKKAA